MKRNRGKNAPFQIAEITDRIANMRKYADEGNVAAIEREFLLALERLHANHGHWQKIAHDKAGELLLKKLEE